jgi:hypothetical protein
VPAQLTRAVALALLLLAGCGGDAEIPAREASRCVLQPSDLGSGYVRFDEGRQLRADMAPPRDDPRRFGRTAGWKARFRGEAVVESRVDLFENDDGARRDLDAYRASVRNETVAPDIGDDAIAQSQRQGEVRFFSVAWRTRNATASVSVSGFGARLEDAVALARKQQTRLDRAAG